MECTIEGKTTDIVHVVSLNNALVAVGLLLYIDDFYGWRKTIINFSIL